MATAKPHTAAMIALPFLLIAAAAGQSAKPAPAKPATAKAKPTPAKPKPATKPKPPELQPGSHAAKDGFDVLQVAAPDAAKFIADWKLGTGGKTASTRTVANRPLFIFLLFRGCKSDAAGKCDVVADFVITRPDGTVNDENKGIVIWNKAAPEDAKKPYIGDGALGYGVDDEGPFGDYRVVATVTDRVAGTTVTTEQTLTVAPANGVMPTKPVAPKPVEPAKAGASLPETPAPDAPAPAGSPPADPAK